MPHIVQIILGIILGIVAVGLCCRIAERMIPAGLPRDLTYIGIALVVLASFGSGGHYFGWF